MQDDGGESLGERNLSKRKFFEDYLLHAPMLDKQNPTIPACKHLHRHGQSRILPDIQGGLSP